MQRFVATVERDRLVFLQSPAAQVFDAAANLALTVFLGSTFGGVGAFGAFSFHYHNWPVFLVMVVPACVFAGMTLRSVYRIAFPRTVTLTKPENSLVIDSRCVAELTEIARLHIKFTGNVSPSRYSLLAGTGYGKTISLATSGYTGSLLELQQLGNLIAVFTGRPDLYIR